MDIRDKTHVFVAKNCARTATVATEVIDTLTVPIGSVQVHAKKVDSGAAALSYYGPGELVVTDPAGLVLDATVVKGDAPQIAFNQRSYDGSHNYAYSALIGKAINGYRFTPYAAKVEQVTVINGIDATLQDHSYMIKIRREGTNNNTEKRPSVRTAFFKSAPAGSTVDQIITGLAAYINTNFSNDSYMPVTAVADTTNDELRITASALPWELGKFNYEQLKFTVELVNFTATISNNKYAANTVTSATYPKMVLGAGSYEQVAEMEFQARMETGANRDKLSGNYRRTIVPIEAQPFEDDGTTVNRYDTIVINWEDIRGNFSAGIKQQGDILIFLPLDNNTTNQQDDIIDTLNKYIVTELGVGTAITLS
ncbi:MAG: hypothetical protein GY775_19350 [Candidatus Scalindua sp.]|nr:hypothetical protein [Candidatus Scalindua sp.]